MKNISNFYTGDSSCKECRRALIAARRADKIEEIREYDRKRGQLPERKARVKENNGRWPRSPKLFRSKHPEKYAAHIAVGNALRDGKITKPNECERCGADWQLHGHHEDYAKPLEVVWLCAECHGARHREINEERRAQQRAA